MYKATVIFALIQTIRRSNHNEMKPAWPEQNPGTHILDYMSW